MTDSENVKWIDWTGGECPVDRDTKVEVRFRNSGIYVSSAGARHWGHNDSLSDIIAYRVVEEAATEAPKPNADGWFDWTGGACPVDPTTKVEVRMAAGNQRSVAGLLCWEHIGNSFDITAYRVLKEAATEAPKPDADSWIKWNGGECPVDDDTKVKVRLRNGNTSVKRAFRFHWDHNDGPGDIITYRVVEEAASPAADSADLAQETLQSLGWHFDGAAWVQDAPAQSDNPLDVQVAGTHYKKLRIQPVEYIHANGLGFEEGSAIKYLTRWRDKGGFKDLEKAKHFIDLLIAMETRYPSDKGADRG